MTDEQILEELKDVQKAIGLHGPLLEKVIDEFEDRVSVNDWFTGSDGELNIPDDEEGTDEQ